MIRWGDDWLTDGTGAPVELIDRRTGNIVRPAVVDELTGEVLDPRNLVARPGPGFPDDWPIAFGSDGATGTGD